MRVTQGKVLLVNYLGLSIFKFLGEILSLAVPSRQAESSGGLLLAYSDICR